MSLRFKVFPAVAIASCLGLLPVQSAAPHCSVTIDTPKTGERHGPDVLVTGTADVPAGQYLWIFAHRKGLAIWWPQGGGAAYLDKGEYSVLTNLGGPQDLGADFEIRSQIVDGAENAKLNAWFQRAAETGTYPGIPLPPFVEGCGAPPRVTIVKSR